MPRKARGSNHDRRTNKANDARKRRAEESKEEKEARIAAVQTTRAKREIDDNEQARDRRNADARRKTLTRQNAANDQTEMQLDADRHATALLDETDQHRQQRLDADADRHATVRLDELDAVTGQRLHAQRQRQENMRSRAARNHNIARQPIDPLNPITPVFVGNMDVVCDHCGSYSFRNDSFNCCHGGKVHLEPYPFPPELEKLFLSRDDEGQNFRSNIRRYNTAFSFASMTATLDDLPGEGPPCFRLSGQIYHNTAALHPFNNNPPCFAQLYIYQPSEANVYRLENRRIVTQDFRSDIMEIVSHVLHNKNPYARAYKSMGEIELRARNRAQQQNLPVPQVTMHMTSGSDRRRYNDPLLDEVAAIFTSIDGAPNVPRDIVVHSHSNRLRRIPYLSSNSDPMCYPLFYPTGQPGWSINLPHVPEYATEHRNLVTMLQFYTYQWAERRTFNPLHHGGYLTQQKMVDDFVKIESNRLNYIRQQQSKLRRETYQGLYDHVYVPPPTSNPPSVSQPTSTPYHAPPVENQPPSSPTSNNIIVPPDFTLPSDEPQYNAGTPIILPSSFMGSPRNMTEAYHDAMAIVREFGRPDVFITFTCNEKWPEIQNELKPTQKSYDRPDLMARVFQLYHSAFIRDLVENDVLGRTVYKINVIEFQKRGKPHSHILIHLHDSDKITSPSDIDSMVCAEIPDQKLYPELYEIVTKCMIHGPCGPVLGPDCVCMDKSTNECSKDFPKDFAPHTNFSDKGYPVYRRRDDGRIVMKGDKPLDNRWVIPYNPYLSLKYRCHINVEICVSIKSIKYLFKYVYKGHDCAAVHIRKNDEIAAYLDARYLCAPEAAHRMFSYKMRHSSHSVDRLPVHLPDMQSIFFNPGEEEEAIQAAMEEDTKLTAWFALNASDDHAMQFLYTEIPLHYTWNAKDKAWKKRKRNCKVVIRLYHVSPRDVERYHLRLLLLNVRGATSFDDLLTYHDVIYSSFQESCLARHLIHDNSIWERTLEDACVAGTPYQLREMFSFMLCNCEISSVFSRNLWDTFRSHFIEDHTRSGDSEAISEQKALAHIEFILQGSSKSISNFDLPPLDPSISLTSSDDYDHVELWNDMHNNLTPQQTEIFDAIQQAVANDDAATPKVFFVDGPGGSGKTYLYTTLIHFIKSHDANVMASAMTGIAAILLPNGQTAHKTFRIPVPCLDDTTIRISPTSVYAEQLRSVRLFVIDEASMLSRHQFEAIDRMLRDITGNDTPFGGKVVLLGGDFRQTLPVVRRGSDTVVVENCIISSPLWSIVQRFKLTLNLRALPNEEEFKSFLLKMGDGKLPTKNTSPYADSIEIPYHFTTAEEIVDEIFPEDQLSNNPISFVKRAILCPTNKETIAINSDMLDRLPGDTRTYSSVDSILECTDLEEEENYTVEFLNNLTLSGMPMHNIFLKEGAIAMLLRNINTTKGMTNGIRLIIKRMYDHFLDVQILTGQSEGKRVFIPKMSLTPSDTELPFKIRRVQFPIQLAFAMTINKSQGQTFDKVGIYLNRPCFSHGQLYVAFSRARSHKDIRVKLKETPDQGKEKGRFYTKNIVLRQVLLS